MAKAELWKSFKTHYPHADLSHFEYGVDWYNGGITEARNIYFKGAKRSWGVWGTPIGVVPFGRISEPDRTALYKALGIDPPHEVQPFPKALQHNYAQLYPVPALPFSSTGSDIAPLLKELLIFVDPQIYFTAGVRDIWKETTVTHRSAKEAYKWLAAPCYDYWPQQLNMAVWCASAGCGVSITDPAAKEYPPIILGLLRFHVYFATRRLLYELGCPLPGDPTFAQTSNPYRKTAFERLCIEFGLPRAPDFRWKGGRNHGLGDVFIDYGAGYGPKHLGGGYQNVHVIRGYDKEADTWPSKLNLFAEEGGTRNNGKLVAFIRNDEHGGVQYSWFCPHKGEGLTNAGMGRLNRSIEAFVYCILGAQAKTRSTIAGGSGGATETRQMFLQLLEEAIVTNDIATGIQNYQHALADTKARLDLAVASGLWLLPSRLVLNMSSTVGYNNELQIATSDLGFGVNPQINKATHKSKPVAPTAGVPTPPRRPTPEGSGTQHVERRPALGSKTTGRSLSAHEKNLAALTVVTAAAAWWMFR